MRVLKIGAALAFSAAVSVAGSPAATAIGSPERASDAARHGAATFSSICLHERVVLRPKAVGSLDGAEAGLRIELVQETVCGDVGRSSCIEAGICR